MNWVAIVGGAAVLVVYLAGKRASKGLKEEPSPWENHGGGGGDDGYYGGGGGGDGGGGISLVSPIVAPIGSDIEPEQSGGMTIGEAFIGDIGFASLERGAEADINTEPTVIERSVAKVKIPAPSPGPAPRSAKLPAPQTGALEIATSSVPISEKAATKNNAVVTSLAVGSQPVRTFGKQASAALARTISPVVQSVLVAKPSSVAQVSKASLATIAASTASSTPLASSSLSMSAPVATQKNAVVTSQAVQSQPVRALSTQTATVSAKPVTVSAKTVAPVVAKPIAAKPAVAAPAPKPAPVSTSAAFLSTIRPKSIATKPALMTTQRLTVAR